MMRGQIQMGFECIQARDQHAKGCLKRPPLDFFLLLLLLVVAVGLLACQKTLPERHPMKFASSDPGRPWKPAPDQISPPLSVEKLKGVPPELAAESNRLKVVQLVEVGLRNSPATRLAWEKARAAAANWAAARGEYYPTLSGDAMGAGGRQAMTTGLRGFRGVYGEAGVSLSYLLLDFGGRSARVEQARQTLIAANWNHNQAIQDLLRDVPQAFYAYLGDKARVRASEASLEEAMTSLKSTVERRKAGVSTIADVLQAQAKADQVRFDLVADRGSVEISRGKLATSVGWPANLQFDVAEEPEDVSVELIQQNAEHLIRLAQIDRAELIAARATVRQKEAELREAEAALWPKLTATGNAGWVGLNGKIPEFGNIEAGDTYYGGGIGLQFPIFEGFALRNRVRRAKAGLEAAKSQLRLKQENVIADVWSAFYNFRTAVQQLEASESLLASSTESYRVSLARYRAGAAEIVELLNAQSTLASARARQVRARTNVFVSYAELVHSIGGELPPDAFRSESGPKEDVGDAEHDKK